MLVQTTVCTGLCVFECTTQSRNKRPMYCVDKEDSLFNLALMDWCTEYVIQRPAGPQQNNQE